MDNEILNAKIKSAFLGREDHGIPTFLLQMDFGGSLQGFGGFDLRHKDFGIPLLMRILEVVGVDSWSKLKGQLVRVRRAEGQIIAIGNIVADEWVCPRESCE